MLSLPNTCSKRTRSVILPKKLNRYHFWVTQKNKIMGIIKKYRLSIRPYQIQWELITKMMWRGFRDAPCVRKTVYLGLYMSREKMRFKRRLCFVFSDRCMYTYIKNVKYKHKNACTLQISIYQTSRALITKIPLKQNITWHQKQSMFQLPFVACVICRLSWLPRSNLASRSWQRGEAGRLGWMYIPDPNVGPRHGTIPTNIRPK